jgi:hypothetical protein
MNQNLLASLVCMCKLGYLLIQIKVEEALDPPRGGKFEVRTHQLLVCMRGRIQHCMLSFPHGLVATCNVSVLCNCGKA